jgi:hypothetical protein
VPSLYTAESYNVGASVSLAGVLRPNGEVTSYHLVVSPPWLALARHPRATADASPWEVNLSIHRIWFVGLPT